MWFFKFYTCGASVVVRDTPHIFHVNRTRVVDVLVLYQIIIINQTHTHTHMDDDDDDVLRVMWFGAVMIANGCNEVYN